MEFKELQTQWGWLLKSPLKRITFCQPDFGKAFESIDQLWASGVVLRSDPFLPESLVEIPGQVEEGGPVSACLEGQAAVWAQLPCETSEHPQGC